MFDFPEFSTKDRAIARIHIRRLCGKYGIYITRTRVSTGADAYFYASKPIIGIPYTTNIGDYLASLHEIGHCANPKARFPKEYHHSWDIRPPRLLEIEIEAWKFAIKRTMFPITDQCENFIKWALKGYYEHCVTMPSHYVIPTNHPMMAGICNTTSLHYSTESPRGD